MMCGLPENNPGIAFVQAAHEVLASGENNPFQENLSLEVALFYHRDMAHEICGLVPLLGHAALIRKSAMATYPFCHQGMLRIIAVITQAKVICKILCQLKHTARPPPIAPARARQATFDWVA
jgi:hypothetical protein